jgi:hypothetical protein
VRSTLKSNGCTYTVIPDVKENCGVKGVVL